ncbi:MAG: ATP-dependent DNA helicase RecG [Nitrospinae bacterium CG11_big_fil_rev_8_21_14_0_20_56_8]|nr:MAG: ATP-dependent DNA helicase RecG [Nitrospinae bacterium CG11_big_fil_rev_8_21_14_0_20_56_8]
MRPENLFPLFRTVTSLKGVGARTADLIEKVAGPHIIDLLWHLPSGIIDRRYTPKVKDAIPDSIATITLRITKHYPPHNPRQPYKIVGMDDTGAMSLVFFRARSDYLNKMLPEGEVRVVSGKIEKFGDGIQMTHPDHIVREDEVESFNKVEPVYPLTAGLSLKVMGKAMTAALEIPTELPEWLDGPLVAREKWTTWLTAVQAIHAPESENDLSPQTPNRRRLAYDELLANQLALALVRAHMKRTKGLALKGDGSLREKVRAALPFKLTNSQIFTLGEIDADLAADHRMLRLLQGDVGSGKTVVALMAMLSAVEAGGQAVMMAPTEILARQHLASISQMTESADLQPLLLTGRERGKKREEILDKLKSGAARLVIGTHALFTDDVEYKDLRVTVIDEQHRFGVHQRLTLAAKGRAVDVLVMTATPIPRTLMLTAYGDMDVSRLTEKPAGRKPVQTVLISQERLDEVVGAVKRAVSSGARVYWVCPLIEEQETSDMAAAEARYDHLRSIFGERTGLVHGRLKGADKDAVMMAFKDGNIDVLVATTVIEVGVDVPEASVMVIEHAERFGLAQLHQLRGRIGRGAEKSTCLLVHAGHIGETAKARLTTMRETDDGFIIAERDLQLRGAGELLGTRQSGLPEFRLADIAEHAELLQIARDDAEMILLNDPDLQKDRGQALRHLLYLFERDSAIRYLRSG